MCRVTIIVFWLKYNAHERLIIEWVCLATYDDANVKEKRGYNGQWQSGQYCTVYDLVLYYWELEVFFFQFLLWKRGIIQWRLLNANSWIESHPMTTLQLELGIVLTVQLSSSSLFLSSLRPPLTALTSLCSSSFSVLSASSIRLFTYNKRSCSWWGIYKTVFEPTRRLNIYKWHMSCYALTNNNRVELLS